MTWVVTHWDEVSSLMLVRLTQTNESARCATLLPVLATLPQPLALIEVGASAGLCDLNEAVSRLVARAPTGAMPVVFHSAVLTYLSPEARAQFARTMRNLPYHWISNEAASVFPELLDFLPVPAPTDRATFVLAFGERPIAFTRPHGEHLHWLSDACLTVSGE
nr:DUF2332 family protein [Streptomyces yunnanensis]